LPKTCSDEELALWEKLSRVSRFNPRQFIEQGNQI